MSQPQGHALMSAPQGLPVPQPQLRQPSTPPAGTPLLSGEHKIVQATAFDPKSSEEVIALRRRVHGELLKNLTRMSAVHAPYKGIAPALVDVFAGRITYTFDTGVSGNIMNGKLRPLAVAVARRVEAIPNVPTFEELGVKDMQMDVWFGVAGPGDMPMELLNRLNGAINKSLTMGELPQRLRQLGSDIKPESAAAFSAFWRSELARYADIVRLSGAKLD